MPVSTSDADSMALVMLSLLTSPSMVLTISAKALAQAKLAIE